MRWKTESTFETTKQSCRHFGWFFPTCQQMLKNVKDPSGTAKSMVDCNLTFTYFYDDWSQSFNELFPNHTIVSIYLLATFCDIFTTSPIYNCTSISSIKLFVHPQVSFRKSIRKNWGLILFRPWISSPNMPKIRTIPSGSSRTFWGNMWGLDFGIKYPGTTWWLIPLSKWVITPVINGISRVNPLITGVN